MMSRREQIREKIMARVVVDPVTGCWIWQGPTSGKEGRGKNYPRMNLSGQTVAVHLVMWTNEHGYIPGKKQLDHKCRNRLCVNPDPKHTELVTHKQNQKRRDRARAAMMGHNGGPALECEEITQ
ncbi:HNH endonuclease [Ensifer sesbaniae]|uniref:HNH endonuclease signature motif containing protein n=1 Tax=Ensifer sesbaniae TaxID=1214071 RepID=UPI002000E0A4|nr:HNH endonuclease [Ensifer sesbaniae]